MIESIRFRNCRPKMCNRIPNVYMPCEYVNCTRCVIADRYRRDQLLNDRTILMLEKGTCFARPLRAVVRTSTNGRSCSKSRLWSSSV